MYLLTNNHRQWRRYEMGGQPSYSKYKDLSFALLKKKKNEFFHYKTAKFNYTTFCL